MLTSWEDKWHRANLLFVVKSLTLKITIAKEKMIQTAYWLKHEDRLKNIKKFLKVFEIFFHDKTNAIFENLLLGKSSTILFYVINVWIKELYKLLS